MGAQPLNSREIIERLWDDVRLREEVSSRTTIPELPAHEQVVHAESLRYINMHFRGRPPDPGSAGTGTGLKARVRTRLARFVVHVLADYLEAERDFNANVVRVANTLAADNDRLAHEVRRLAEAMRLESRRLSQEADALHLLLEARVSALEEVRVRNIP